MSRLWVCFLFFFYERRNCNEGERFLEVLVREFFGNEGIFFFVKGGFDCNMILCFFLEELIKNFDNK